jgi:uncharacterized membrane protein YeaQ/YmgE (transglycosylase-associated protein family)
MIGFDDVLAWIAIGVAASLAGMIWPFRRGAVGVMVNIAIGAIGAVALASLSDAFLSAEHRGPLRLLFAALGSVGALLIAHGAWELRVRHMGPARRSA